MRMLIVSAVAGLSMAASAASASAAEARGSRLAAGWGHSLVITADGGIRAWGDGRRGQLGDGRFAISHAPAAVLGPGGTGRLDGVVAVAAGLHHSLAVRADGSLWAWGDNTFGQLGNGQWGLQHHSAVPVRVVGPDGTGRLEGVVAASAGWDHSAALLRDGTVWAWGSRCQGQLGDGSRDSNRWSAVPVAVRAPSGEGLLRGVTAVACGAFHTLARREDGTVLAWGGNHEGQLGRGRWADRMHRLHLRTTWAAAKPGDWHLSLSYTYTNPSQAAAANRIRLQDAFDGPALQVAAGDAASGPASGRFARRGDGVSMQATIAYPARVAAGAAVSFDLGEVLVGLHARDDDVVEEVGLVLTNRAAGEEVRLALPVDRFLAHALPAPVVGAGEEGHLGGVRAVAAGVHHAVALLEDGTVWAWGHNGTGQLGDGTRERRGSPVQSTDNGRPAAPLTGIAAVAAGNEHTVALDAAGKAWVCGWNVYGQTGAGERGDSAGGYPNARPAVETVDGTPVAVAGLTAVAAGAFHTLALGAEGRLLAWGHNGYGQLADGSLTDRNVAVPCFGLAEACPLPPARAASRPPARAATLDWRLADPAAGAPGVLNVREHGVCGDGTHLDQAALQAAIDAVHAAGGGTVLLPRGTYRTGSLFLRSNVRLHLADGATMLGSTNRDHYLAASARPGLIVALGAERIALTGRGVIDGQGQFCPNRGWRHRLLNIEDCQGVTIEGITTMNSGSWTQHYVKCRDLTIRGVTVNSVRPRRNNDGMDLSGCQDVLIEGCLVASEDDAIVIKSQAADRVNRNIRVVNNTVLTLCNGFKLGTETRGVFEDIVCEDLRAYGGSSLGVWSVDGAQVRRVRIERVRAEDSRFPLGIRLGARLTPSYFAPGEERVPGSIQGVVMRHIDVTMAERSFRDVLLDHGIENAEIAHQSWIRPAEAGFICGLPGLPVRDVLLEDVSISVPGGGSAEDARVEVPERPTAYPNAGMFGTLPAWGIYVRHAEGIILRQVRLALRSPDARQPVLGADLAEGALRIDGLEVRETWQP